MAAIISLALRVPFPSPSQARDRAALQKEEARVNAKVEAEWFSALRSEYGMAMEDVPTAFAAWQKCREAGESGGLRGLPAAAPTALLHSCMRPALMSRHQPAMGAGATPA